MRIADCGLRIAGTLAALMLLQCGAFARGEEPVSFSREVAPVLMKNCLACHGPREPKGGFQLASYQLLLKPGESGSPSVEPGKPEESQVVALITAEDEDERMPKEADPLAPSEIAVVKRWIAEGAKYDATDPAAPLASIVPKLPQPEPPDVYRRPVPVTALAFSADGQDLAVGGYHEVTIWNVANGQLVRRIKNVEERTYSLAYSPDGSLLAVAGGTPGVSGEVKLFQPSQGILVKDLGAMADVELHVAFNPAGNKLAACGADRGIRIYDVASGQQERLIEEHADWVISTAWSPDGGKIASASRDKTAKVFNAVTGESLVTYTGHNESVFGVAWNADGKRVFTAGGDKKIHAWNPDDGVKSAEVAGFSREVLALASSQDKLFSASADKNTAQHRGDGLQLFRNYAGHTDAVYAVAFHPGTGRVASGSFTGEVRVWNAEDGAAVATFIAAPGYAGIK